MAAGIEIGKRKSRMVDEKMEKQQVALEQYQYFLNKKTMYLKGILELTRSIVELNEPEFIEEINNTIELRQSLMSSIDEIDLKIIDIEQLFNSSRNTNITGNDYDFYQNIQRDNFNDLIVEIQSLDKKLRLQLEKIFETMQEKSGKIRAGHQLMRVYSGRLNQVNSLFIDQKK